MLQVGVVGACAEDVRSAATRVRHVCLEHCDPADPSHPVWETAAAIAFVGNARPDETLAAAILAGGKHLLCATGLIPTASESQRWFELARTQRTQVSIVNPQRARPSRRLIRQHIENGKLGDVGLVRINRTIRSELPAESPTPAARLNAALVGDVDLALWLMGRSPDTVYAVRRPMAGGAAADAEFQHVHLGFPQGGMALLTFSAVDSIDDCESLSVIAFNGAAYADDHQNRQLLFGSGPATALRADEGDTLAFLIDEFALSVKGETDPDALLSHWRRIEAIAGAVERSASSRQAIGLELD